MIALVLVLLVEPVVGPGLVDDDSPTARQEQEQEQEQEDAAAPPWVYFGAAAGLSLTTSVLMLFPELLLSLVSGTATAFFVLAAAPIVVGFGLERLDRARATVPIVGAVIGDVGGALGGGIAGALLLGPLLGERVPRLDLVNDERARLIGTASGALLGAWVLRALGAGLGAAIGRGLSLTFFDPIPET